MPNSKRPHQHGGRRKRRDKDEAPPLPITDAVILKQVHKNLDKSRFIVFDIETTGGNPEKNGITELFALRFADGQISETFYSMVNPGISIPPIVRRMTGITNAMVKDAPPISQVIPNFVKFIEGDILVSHNTIGDMKFLRHFSEQVCGTPINNFYLCTHLLVEKLAPESPDKSLKGLAKHFQLPSGSLHRAEADTYLTHELFKVLLRLLGERSVRTVEEAVRIQGDMESASRLGWGVKEESLKSIPMGVGLFYLYDHERRLLFLSSAMSLSREIAKLQRHQQIPRQLLRLVLRSYDLQVERVPNLYAAMLKECEASVGSHITFNPLDWHQRCMHTLFITESSEGARINVGPVTEGSRYVFGPINDRREAQEFLESIAKALNLKVTRHGVILPSSIYANGADILSMFVGGTLEAEIKKISRSLLSIRMLFRKVERKRLKDQLEIMKNLAAIKKRPQVHSLLEESGLIIVPDDSTGSWQLHTIVGSRSRGETNVKGDWEAKLHQAGFGRRIVEKIQKESIALKTGPLTALDAARVNATIWWLHTNAQRKEGTFVSLVDLEQWLQKQK